MLFGCTNQSQRNATLALGVAAIGLGLHYCTRPPTYEDQVQRVSHEVSRLFHSITPASTTGTSAGGNVVVQDISHLASMVSAMANLPVGHPSLKLAIDRDAAEQQVTLTLYDPALGQTYSTMRFEKAIEAYRLTRFNDYPQTEQLREAELVLSSRALYKLTNLTMPAPEQLTQSESMLDAHALELAGAILHTPPRSAFIVSSHLHYGFRGQLLVRQTELDAPAPALEIILFPANSNVGAPTSQLTVELRHLMPAHQVLHEFQEFSKNPAGVLATP